MPRTDINKYPVFGILSTVMCFVGLIMSVYFVMAGLHLFIRFLELILKFRPDDVAFVETYRTIFVLVVLSTAALALTVLFSDFIRTNARFTGLQTCKSCQGPLTCIALLFLLFIAALAWLLIFRKVAHAHFAFVLIAEPCDSDKNKIFDSSTCLDFNNTLTWIFPNKTSPTPVCGSEFKRTCEQYAFKARPDFEWAIYGISIVVLSLFQFLVCTGANYAYSFYSGRAAVLAPRELSSSSSSFEEPPRPRPPPPPPPPPPKPKRQTIVNVVGDDKLVKLFK